MKTTLSLHPSLYTVNWVFDFLLNPVIFSRERRKIPFIFRDLLTVSLLSQKYIFFYRRDLSLFCRVVTIVKEMSSAQDPFYIVKEEIQESIDNLQATSRRWEQTQSNTGEHVHITKEIIASCESIEWQVDELSKTISVAAQDPAFYGLDELELEKRRRWTATARNQVSSVRKVIEAGWVNGTSVSSGLSGTRRELMRLPNDYAPQAGAANHRIANDNDDFISSESDTQQLLIRQQDEELDELSASVQRIGGVGLTIHEELTGQERILDGLSMEMETTSNRLDFVQKKVAMVMKKASAKGQLMMIAFLVVLFMILFILVFFT